MILKTELSNDPLARNYNAMTDQQCAADLNQLTRSRIIPITSATLLAWAGAGADDNNAIPSRYERIQTAANNHPSGAIRGASKAAIAMIQRDQTNLDLSLPDRAQMVAALVAGDVLTSAEYAELIAIGQKTISRAQELGLPPIYPADVAGARANG